MNLQELFNAYEEAKKQTKEERHSDWKQNIEEDRKKKKKEEQNFLNILEQVLVENLEAEGAREDSLLDYSMAHLLSDEVIRGRLGPYSFYLKKDGPYQVLLTHRCLEWYSGSIDAYAIALHQAKLTHPNLIKFLLRWHKPRVLAHLTDDIQRSERRLEALLEEQAELEKSLEEC